MVWPRHVMCPSKVRWCGGPQKLRFAMKFSITRVLALAGFAIALPLLSASAPAVAKNPYECFTDDGYGRKLPCSFRYKQQNPKWRNSNDCFTDEGYGRYRPCDAFIKTPTTSRN